MTTPFSDEINFGVIPPPHSLGAISPVIVFDVARAAPSPADTIPATHGIPAALEAKDPGNAQRSGKEDKENAQNSVIAQCASVRIGERTFVFLGCREDMQA